MNDNKFNFIKNIDIIERNIIFLSYGGLFKQYGIEKLMKMKKMEEKFNFVRLLYEYIE